MAGSGGVQPRNRTPPGAIPAGVSDFERQIITGLVILVAVVLDAYRLRLGRKLAVIQPAQALTPATVPS